MIEVQAAMAGARSASEPGPTAYKLLREGRLEDALPLAENATRGSAVCTPAHGMLATILCGLGRAEEAENVIVSALKLELGSGDAYDAMAYVSISLGKPERANDLYRRAVERDPLSARFWYNLASSERSLGHMSKAEAACDRAIVLDRRYYPSHLLRSELRVQTADSNHVEELQSLLAMPGLDDRGWVALGYALGKELDDLGRYDEAFRWFAAAAQARRRHLSYDVNVDEKKIQRISEMYSEQYPTGHGTDKSFTRFVFIVGLPRSGTTLLERILTGLRGVRTNGETDNFSRALLAATPPGNEDIFFRATRADPEAIARTYGVFARVTADQDLIVEKLPLNYLYLGAIYRALPGAKLILMQRSPLDSCFAMYRTLFGQGYPFSYDFEDLARYYAAYDRLMRHWRRLLGASLHDVNYEDLIQHPHEVGAAVAEFCGCRWQASALRIEENRGASFTASASQIRRPIYGTSVHRWRHYREHLSPLARRLEQLGVRLD